MGFRLFRMGIEGKVAAANLALIGCALSVLLANEYIESEGWLSARAVAQVVVAVLGFPVGWLATLGQSVSGPHVTVIITAAIYLPLNAYLWGYVVAAVIRRYR